MAPPLWVKSNASFLAGASHPEELVRTAAAQGHAAMALTDLHGVYGAVRAHVAAKEVGLKLLVGAEVRVVGAGTLLLLAPSRNAYGNLCQLLGALRLAQPKQAATGVPMAVLEGALQHFAAGLVALCPDAALLPRLHAYFGAQKALYGLVVRHLRAYDAAAEHALVQTAAAHGVPVAAGSEVLYHDPGRRALLDVMRCIQARTSLQEAGLRLQANASYAMASPAQMARRFADRPAWLACAHAIAERCDFSLDELRYRYPVQKKLGARDADTQLAARARAGLRRRYGSPAPEQVTRQLASELQVVAELGYAAYFLSMQDIVLFCRRNNILCQGRGSAANSVLCYCLGITAIDPVAMKLLFSRFLSKARAEPPDIDLDIEHHRREEVIQWLYNDHGRRHAAMVANVVRFRWRSAIREVGLALGLDPAPLTKLGRRVALGYEAVMGAYAGGGDVQAWAAECGLSAQDPRVGHLLRLAHDLRHAPRHLSVHPGGFVLGQDAIDTLCPLEPASMPGRTVLQWDKQDIDDVGLFKVDLLGLGALSQVHQTFDLVRTHTGQKLELATVPQEDPATYAMLCRADSIGVFQVESRAQMGMLPRLRPRTFYDLVVQVAIVRPGPIQGDMVHPYLRQREGSAPVRYPHPSFAEVLEKTFGVPIFQEQVMKLAILAAGYDPDEADKLRRDMVAWGSHERLEAHHRRIVEGMRTRGVDGEFAERLFAQIRGFGAYGFPESHAASFAHIVYVTAYLRCHHLAAFTCALLNSQPMGFYSPASIVADARRQGLSMRPLDVQQSAWDCTLEPCVGGRRGPWAVRMGLRYVRGWGGREQRALAEAPPPYASLADFVRRTGLGERACLQLLEAGGLDGVPLGEGADVGAADGGGGAPGHRRAAWWQLRACLQNRHDSLPLPTTVPMPAALARPLHRHEQVAWDVAASQHSTRGHPVEVRRARLRAAGIDTAAQINATGHARWAAHAGLMICRQRPETAKGMTFVTLEDETGLVNVVIFPQENERFAELLQTEPMLGVSGTVQVRHGTVHLLARRLFVPP